MLYPEGKRCANGKLWFCGDFDRKPLDLRQMRL